MVVTKMPRLLGHRTLFLGGIRDILDDKRRTAVYRGLNGQKHWRKRRCMYITPPMGDADFPCSISPQFEQCRGAKIGRQWKHIAESFPNTYRSVLVRYWFGIGTLLAVEQSSLENRPRGAWYIPSAVYGRPAVEELPTPKLVYQV